MEYMQTIFKRYTVQLASLMVLSASLAACGGGGGGSAPSANATDAQVSTPAAPESTAPATSTPVTSTPIPSTPATSSPPAASTPPVSSPSPVTSTPQDPTPTPTVVNHAPTISGVPAPGITSGQAYSFVPTAADADHDALQFSISSKPSWATFDVTTGKLYGVPGSASLGSYEEIEISVSDGKVVTKLPQFAIVVSPAAATTRSVHVTWQAPTLNTDGSALTDLKGYRIVYGTQPGVYTNSVPVNGTGLVDYTIENLQTGKKYYVSMVAVNAAGAESDYSPEVVVNLT
jgi:hypothetical protein